MKAYALLGGPETEWPHNINQIFKQAKKENNLIVGVDRGSLLLEEMHIVPDLAIGDFDSLKKEELSQIESNVPDIRYSNPVKDLTDSELMLQIVFEDYHVDNLVVLGASGGRLDHFLVNILMLLNPRVEKYAERIEFLDKQNLVKYYLPGQHIVKKQLNYSYFGVGNLSPVKDLKIDKARYDLANYNNIYPRIFSSNEFKKDTDSFNLSFKKGLIIVIFAKDIDRFQNIK